MIRAARLQACARQAARSYRFQSTLPPTPVKKSRPVRKFFFRLSLLTATFYLGGGYLATKNDAIQDAFEDFVPFGEFVVSNIEYYSYHKDELLSPFSKVNDSFADVKEKLGLEKTVPIPKQGVQSDKIELKKEEETPTETAVGRSLPLLHLETGDQVIDSTVNALNELIAAMNLKVTSLENQQVVESLHRSLTSLAEKYKTFSTAKQLEQGVVDEQLKTYLNQKEVELTQEFVNKLEEAKKQLEERHSKQLEGEIGAAEKRIQLEALNLIEQSKLAAIEQFNKVISEKVDSERANKLKDLDALAARVSEIEKYQLELGKSAGLYYNYRDIKKSIGALQGLLLSNESSPKRGEELVKELDNLKKLVASLDNDLITQAINALPSNDTLLRNGGVLTQSQLLARWELLLPELRSVSLLPPNAGLVGHISSFVFSKLLFAKSGKPVKTDDELIGNDIESVIARVNEYLVKNELDNAVEEVSNMKGWARKLADDWLAESRRKLELQFLVDLLETEVDVSV
ncbi:hypothetical protein OGAPHI_002027 [Ogataea philodendri]|uniref:MICOS complex subunit MIC60 n=1 Tax=Ogataea philodendri TaxID=1378263 RepID=A0A9P8P9P3_9ASCO|nr:uncharacterized protein OGAPHI_002027 [Ogataea philodendri]KAH3668273.1 hypothetical protein OGAPHI_002027 [Ogataea philodendri]